MASVKGCLKSSCKSRVTVTKDHRFCTTCIVLVEYATLSPQEPCVTCCCTCKQCTSSRSSLLTPGQTSCTGRGGTWLSRQLTPTRPPIFFHMGGISEPTGAFHDKWPISAVYQFCACPCPQGLMCIFMEGHVDLLPHKLQAIFNAFGLYLVATWGIGKSTVVRTGHNVWSRDLGRTICHKFQTAVLSSAFENNLTTALLHF